MTNFEVAASINSKADALSEYSLRKTVGKSVTDSGYAYVTQWF